MNNELPQTLPGFDPTCYSDKENSVPCVSKPNFVNDSSNIFNPHPQPPIHSCEFCESNAQYGHYCTPQVLFINQEPGYSQDFNFPQDIHNFQQRGPHETFQCQPTNEDYYHEQNSCYNSNSFSFDHCQPLQHTVNHPIFNAHNDVLSSQTTLMENMILLTSMCEMLYQIVQKKQEEKRIKEVQAAKAQNWKLPVCYDDDDDEERSNSLQDNIISGLPSCSAVTPSEPVDSLSMGDEHPDTIPATKSDEFINPVLRTLSQT
nr:hypothetical protein [Tanacetum cinerariifolium]